VKDLSPELFLTSAAQEKNKYPVDASGSPRRPIGLVFRPTRTLPRHEVSFTVCHAGIGVSKSFSAMK
jgi:hypothetical protein